MMRCKKCKEPLVLHHTSLYLGIKYEHWITQSDQEFMKSNPNGFIYNPCTHVPQSETERMAETLSKYTQRKNPFLEGNSQPWKKRWKR